MTTSCSLNVGPYKNVPLRFLPSSIIIILLSLSLQTRGCSCPARGSVSAGCVAAAESASFHDEITSNHHGDRESPIHSSGMEPDHTPSQIAL